MRPGLVALGTGFLALAVAGVVALFLIPIPTPPYTNSTTTTWTAAGHSANGTEIAGSSTVHGSFQLSWATQLPLVVKVYTSQGCDPGVAGCPPWQLVFNSSDDPVGNFSEGSPVHFPFLFSWANPSGQSGGVELTAATTTQAQTTLSPVSQLLLGLGVAALGFVGAVAFFLGLFLRGGVYSGRGGPAVRPPPDHVPPPSEGDGPPAH